MGRLRRLVPVVLAAASAAAGLGAPRAVRADVVPGFDSLVRPGHTFQGDVPAGETIRFTVELAEGAELKAQFTLAMSAADQYLPANFQRVSVSDVTDSFDVLDDTGVPVPFDRGVYSYARYDPVRKTSTFVVNRWPAPSGGRFQFAITHLTRTQTRCIGKIAAVRPRKIPITGTLDAEEDARTFTVPVQPDDALRVSVVRKGRTGSAPLVDEYQAPGEIPEPPFQKRSRKGSVTERLFMGEFGDATFRVAAQAPQDPVGTFKGTITLRPGGPYGKLGMTTVNPPGVPLTVRDVEAFTDVPWATHGIGLADANGYVLVTAENGGQVRAKVYDAFLTDPFPFVAAQPLVTSADVPAGQTVRGHRTVKADGKYFVAFSTQSGGAAGLSRFNQNLIRDGFLAVPSSGAPPGPTNDLFLTADDFTVSVGLPNTSNGHVVHQFDLASLAAVGPPVTIGGAIAPHGPGASAVYRRDQNVFEFWAPTSLLPGDSDLHHGLFSPSFQLVDWDANAVQTAGVNETMPSALVYDEPTGVTILHYVVPQSVGRGVLHRRLYDPLGAEIPGSHASLGIVLYDRPTAMIVGDDLYLGAEGASNPTVTRYRLLRQ